jgi:hypothetical protein
MGLQPTIPERIAHACRLASGAVGAGELAGALALLGVELAAVDVALIGARAPAGCAARGSRARAERKIASGSVLSRRG